MFNWWTTRTENARKADDLYGAVVAQARNPLFYRDYGVPDTMAGRYELIVLHLAAVMERLSDGDEPVGETASSHLQAGKASDTDADRSTGTATIRLLVERFVTDMDDCMRELGVGDFTVPKRVKRAVAGLYERSALLRQVRKSDSDLATLIADMIAAGQVFLPDEDADTATAPAPSGDEGAVASAGGEPAAANLNPPKTPHCDSARLAAYVRQMQSQMAGQPADRIATGKVAFPDPATVFAPA